MNKTYKMNPSYVVVIHNVWFTMITANYITSQPQRKCLSPFYENSDKKG